MTDLSQLEATVPGFVFTWQSQARQYPKVGPPGITYELHHLTLPVTGEQRPVDTLLHRGRKGQLTGLLWHYPQGVPPWQAPGSVNLFVRPDRQRRGIGRRLLLHAEGLWHPCWEQQDYTAEGLALVRAVIRT